MANKDTTFEYHPVGAPTCLCKQEVEKPSWNTAQPCARLQGYVNNDLRADVLRKGWGLRVGTWNVDSLTGRGGGVVEALSDRKVVIRCAMSKLGVEERLILAVISMYTGAKQF